MMASLCAARPPSINRQPSSAPPGSTNTLQPPPWISQAWPRSTRVSSTGPSTACGRAGRLLTRAAAPSAPDPVRRKFRREVSFFIGNFFLLVVEGAGNQFLQFVGRRQGPDVPGVVEGR